MTDTADRLYASVGPLATQDKQLGLPLQKYLTALATMIDPVASVVRDPDAGVAGPPGWAKLFNVTDPNYPSQWLPWVAQFIGLDVTNIPVSGQPAAITSPPSYLRGTVAGIVQAAQATLTGSQTVYVSQRLNGNQWALGVYTIVSQTPNWPSTVAAILAVKPAGVILTFGLIANGQYSELPAEYSTYSAIPSGNSTYSQIPTH